LFICIKTQLAGWQNGFKVFPITMRENIKTGSETREKRALAVNKNMLFGHRRYRTYRIYNSNANKTNPILINGAEKPWKNHPQKFLQ
jgi:hypothetical protein